MADDKKRDWGGWSRWLIGLLFIAGVVYGQIRELPKKVIQHHDRISKLEYTVSTVETDLREIKSDIKELLKR